MSTKFKIRSQLPLVEKGGILDDCGPASCAAAVPVVIRWLNPEDKAFGSKA